MSKTTEYTVTVKLKAVEGKEVKPRTLEGVIREELRVEFRDELVSVKAKLTDAVSV